MHRRLIRFVHAAFACALAMIAAPGPASVVPLPSGVEAHNGTATIRVTALTDSILRVRIGRGPALPEDAS